MHRTTQKIFLLHQSSKMEEQDKSLGQAPCTNSSRTFLCYLPSPQLRGLRTALAFQGLQGRLLQHRCVSALAGCRGSILQQHRPLCSQGHILQLPTARLCLTQSSSTSLGSLHCSTACTSISNTGAPLY